MTEIELAGERLPELTPVVMRQDKNPYWAYLARFDSDETIRTMQRCLDRLGAILVPTPPGTRTAVGQPAAGYGALVPWWQIGPGGSSLLRKALTSGAGAQNGKKWSAAHINKHLAAFRQVIKQSWRLGYISAEERDRIIDIPGVAEHREPAGRDIQDDEVASMLAACLATPGPIGTRDAAIIAALLSTGGRRAEVAGMLIELYDHSERAVKLTGKGNRQRVVFLHAVAAVYVDRWLALVGKRRGPVFRPVDKHENIADRHLSPRAIGLIVDQRREQCNLPLLSTHDYRRTFIGNMLDAGNDLATVQALVGHASPVTTARYDRRGLRARRVAVDKLTMPAVASECLEALMPQSLLAQGRSRSCPLSRCRVDVSRPPAGHARS